MEPLPDTKKILIVLLVATTAVYFVFFFNVGPPDDVVRQGITQNVRMQALRLNPFVNNEKTRVESYTIKNSYSRDGLRYYEYEARVRLTAELFNSRDEVTRTVRGTEAFRKAGSRWEMIDIE